MHAPRRHGHRSRLSVNPGRPAVSQEDGFSRYGGLLTTWCQRREGVQVTNRDEPSSEASVRRVAQRGPVQRPNPRAMRCCAGWTDERPGDTLIALQQVASEVDTPDDLVNRVFDRVSQDPCHDNLLMAEMLVQLASTDDRLLAAVDAHLAEHDRAIARVVLNGGRS